MGRREWQSSPTYTFAAYNHEQDICGLSSPLSTSYAFCVRLAHKITYFGQARADHPCQPLPSHGNLPMSTSGLRNVPMNALGNSRMNEVVAFGPFRLFKAERLLKKGNESLPISGRALDLLIALVERSGDVLSHKELSAQVWPGVTVEEANLRVHIASVRKILGDGRDGARFIANVAGRGYCFVAPTQRQSGQSATALAEAVDAPTLPPRLQRMIGRDESIDALRTMLISQRFVSIVGPGGMGKTTAAIAVAHTMMKDFDGAIRFVDLSALKDSALVIPAIASAVGYHAQTQGSLATLVAFLAGQRLLLVLDSCEHVVETVAALTELLFRDAPFVHIVVTSREPLQVPGENLYWLSPLGFPPSEATSTDALSFPAVQLFFERAAAGGYIEDVGDDDAAVVAGICRQLDGIPLAIELIAGQVGKYGIRGVAGLISDRLALFWQGRRSASRHQTLRATLDWSYDLLCEDEKMVLCRLSLFVGPFTLQAARLVAAEPGEASSQFVNIITKLVDNSLLLACSGDDDGLYRLLDTTRAYATLKLAGREAEGTIARRHALWFAEHLAPNHLDFLRSQRADHHSRQIGDVRSALQWSFSPSGDVSIGVALAVGAASLFLNSSMLSECQHWCRKAISALDETDRGTQRELTLQTSLAMSSMFAQSDSEEVDRALERGLTLAETLRDTEQLMHLLAGRNIFWVQAGDFAGARAAAERYSAAAAEFGGPREKVVGDWMLGGSHHLLGNQTEAQRHYESGFERAAAIGLSRGHFFGFDREPWARIGLSRTLWLRGFPAKAAHFSDRGIEFARRGGHPVSLCICLTYGAEVFLWSGDEHVAGGLIDELITVAEKHSLVPYYACGLVRLGELLVARNETTAGIEHLRRARSILATERNYILFPTISRTLALGLLEEGRPQEALDLIDATVADAERGSGTFELPDLLRTKARALLAVSPQDWTSAESVLMASLNLARRQSSLAWELRAAIALFRLWRDHERADAAHDMLATVYGRYTEGFETADLRTARSLLCTTA
jgi:predicted ATPase/DNA-binding winged helix-turn-helix (wHTH) protein